MKLVNRINIGLEGFSQALVRFPLTVVFLFAVAILNSIMINAQRPELDKYLITMVVGAFFSVLFQMIYERFGKRRKTQIVLYLFSMVLTAIYFFIYGNVTEVSQELIVRTVVIILGIFMAFVWIPSIKSQPTFNQSFLVVFKTFFISIFFTGIIFFGLTIIYAATDLLLFDVPGEIYAHTANIVFVIFANIYFLSLIPKYSKNDDKILKAINCPKFLEVLLSYIIIPLTSIFTLILLIYIATNISNSFWEDDLLEVMLVLYIIVVILIYILVSNVNNRFATLFKLVFPKILVLIVLFQTANSGIRIGDYGITYGRYYVILFGIFALITGIWFSIKPKDKNGIVALALIVCVVVSLMPFLDPFKLSKTSQMNLLEEELNKNNMIVGDEVIENPEIEIDSKKKISSALSYIYRMDYEDEISWLPDSYIEVENILGFSPYVGDPKVEGRDIQIYLNDEETINVEGYEYMVNTHIAYEKNNELSGRNYQINNDIELNIIYENNDVAIEIMDKDISMIKVTGKELTENLREDYTNSQEIKVKDSLKNFSNEKVDLAVIFRYLDMASSSEDYRFDGETYILINIK